MVKIFIRQKCIKKINLIFFQFFKKDNIIPNLSSIVIQNGQPFPFFWLDYSKCTNLLTYFAKNEWKYVDTVKNTNILLFKRTTLPFLD